VLPEKLPMAKQFLISPGAPTSFRNKKTFTGKEINFHLGENLFPFTSTLTDLKKANKLLVFFHLSFVKLLIISTLEM
jgi:hypothetical protein